MAEDSFDEFLEQFRDLLRKSPPRDLRGEHLELLTLTIMELMDRRLTRVEALQEQFDSLKEENAELRQGLRDLDKDFEAQGFALCRALNPETYRPGPRAKTQRARQELREIMSAEREVAEKPRQPGPCTPKPP
jgi:cell division protein FtsB